MPSKVKRQEAREKHKKDKRRGRYRRVLKPFLISLYSIDPNKYDLAIQALSIVSLKVIQQLHSDMRSSTGILYGRDFQRKVENLILERTILT